jgi:serine/threonine-protein kinase mTOR
VILFHFSFLECIVSGDVVNTTTRISRYSHNLRSLLPSNDVGVMELAAVTLVKLAMLPGSKGAESFEFDIKRSFEWLSEERNEGKRHAAVLVLRELANSMPTFFYHHVQSFFENIFNAIRDPKAMIREGAGEALRACLVVTSQRENVKQQTNNPKTKTVSTLEEWYRKCFQEAMTCFGDVPLKEKGVSKDDRVHGALIVLNEILRCSNANWEKKYENLKRLKADDLRSNDESSQFSKLKPPFIEKLSQSSRLNDFDSNTKFSRQTNILESSLFNALVREHFDEICAKVMEQRLCRSQSVQQMLLFILPRLAAFNRDVFVRKHLKNTIVYLLGILKGKEKDKNLAFVTLGFIAVAVEKDIDKYLTGIMEIIRSVLPVKDAPSSKKKTFSHVFFCITLIGHAVKSGISSEIKSDILESMMSTGLSPSLTSCLRELAENIPFIKREISDGLLKMLSQVLMNKQIAIGTPKHNLTAQFAALTATDMTPDVPTVVLALKTLGTFNFEGHDLLPFVQRCADHYLVSDQREIRLEAIQTCTRILKISIKATTEANSIELLKDTVSHVLEKLLIVGITDTDPVVRLCVLKSLDGTFDHQLAQPWFLSSLLITLNDEIFEIRELAIITIGRLSSKNPAYVMPSLRKTLVQLLNDLEHSGMSRNKEQSARQLDHLIVNTPRLISSYMRPILAVLVPKLRDTESNPGVILNVLRAIGDLSEVNGSSNVMEKWADELLAILLEMLNDASSTEKRFVALWTLGQLISATGQVVTPYYKYPYLIDILINFLKTEQQTSIRRETIRVLGLLGALDPYKHKMNRGLIDSQKDNILISISDFKNDECADLSTAEMLVTMGNMLEDYYPAIAISTLMKILKDPTLSQHHTSVVQAVTFIFKMLGIKCVVFMSQVSFSFVFSGWHLSVAICF